MKLNDLNDIKEMKEELAILRETMNKKKPTITYANNPLLQSKVDNFVEMIENRYNFSGSYDVYSLYVTQQEGEEGTYALIYTDHLVSKDLKSEEFNKTVKMEAQILHRELLESGLELDYFFIVPYTSIIGESGWMGEAQVTKDW